MSLMSLAVLRQGFGLRRPKVGFGRLKVGRQSAFAASPDKMRAGASQPKLRSSEGRYYGATPGSLLARENSHE